VASAKIPSRGIAVEESKSVRGRAYRQRREKRRVFYEVAG
jgi:hypothetical protein